jgi:FAD/FMN-containing dehydrogenase
MDTVTTGELDAFRTTLRGNVLKRGDAEYDQARVVWNAMIDKHPAAIVRCAGAADVRAAVTFARDHLWPLAVRGGGHNITGSALCEDGMVIDLSPMRSVQIDEHRQRAYVEGGATLRDIDHEAQAYALATPLGINSTTGIGGLTLGGGFGWLTRKLGMTIDNLLSADMVLADSTRLRVSARDNPDLFWAIRGGGGNFGVVTNFEFQLHAVGPEVTAGLIFFPLAQAKTVLTKYRDAVAGLGDDVTAWAILRKAPPLPFLPLEAHGAEVLALAIFSALQQDAVQGIIDQLRGFDQPVGEMVGAMPYVAWQQILDPLLSAGARNYWKSHNFTRLGDEAIDIAIDAAGKLPSPHCEVIFALLGGKAGAPAPADTAYAHRTTPFIMNVHGRWETPDEDAKCMAWARALFNAQAPHAAGSVYSNFMSQDESERIPQAYGTNYARLAQIKAKYDPHNLFRSNQNIRPSP